MYMVSGPSESKVYQVQVSQAKSVYGVKSSSVQRQPMRFSDPRGKMGKAIADSCVEVRGRTLRPKGC